MQSMGSLPGRCAFPRRGPSFPPAPPLFFRVFCAPALDPRSSVPPSSVFLLSRRPSPSMACSGFGRAPLLLRSLLRQHLSCWFIRRVAASFFSSAAARSPSPGVLRHCRNFAFSSRSPFHETNQDRVLFFEPPFLDEPPHLAVAPCTVDHLRPGASFVTFL